MRRMLPAFGAPHEMRWHSFVQYLNMPSILAWHLRHLPQAIKRFHRFIAVQHYSPIVAHSHPDCNPPPRKTTECAAFEFIQTAACRDFFPGLGPVFLVKGGKSVYNRAIRTEEGST